MSLKGNQKLLKFISRIREFVKKASTRQQRATQAAIIISSGRAACIAERGKAPLPSHSHLSWSHVKGNHHTCTGPCLFSKLHTLSLQIILN